VTFRDETITAVVLGGARNDGEMSEASDTDYEAFIELGSQPIIQYVLDALEETEAIDSKMVVGFPEFSECLLLDDDQLIPAGETFIESMQAAIDAAPESGYLYFVTADVPLLSGDIIDDFIGRCSDPDSELFVPIVTKEQSEKQFPEIERTYAKLREDEFTIGNCFLIQRSAVSRLMPVLKRLVRLRKSPVRMALTLGLGLLLRLATGTCSLSYAEAMVERLTGVVGRAIVVPDAEIALDVDNPAQLREVEKLIK